MFCANLLHRQLVERCGGTRTLEEFAQDIYEINEVLEYGGYLLPQKEEEVTEAS